jgi:butyrate kinase
VVRSPLYKSLSQRAGATFYAWQGLRKVANEARVIAAHLGREISVGAFDRGRLVDNNCVQEGEGPFSPESCGTLPLDAMIDLCYSGRYDMDEMITMITSRGGLAAYLDDPSLENVAAEYRAGGGKAAFLVDVMAASVSREIGARAASLRGKVDAIVIMGPWAEFEEFVALIKSRVSWIAPIQVFPYMGELVTLALYAEIAYFGGSRILLYGRDRMKYK